MKKITFTSTIEIDEIEIDVTVNGTFYAGSIGIRHGFDRFAEPDEPAEFNIESVVCNETGVEFFENEISANDWERLENEGAENATNREFDFIDEY